VDLVGLLATDVRPVALQAQNRVVDGAVCVVAWCATTKNERLVDGSTMTIRN